jgi:hypothetical protein
MDRATVVSMFPMEINEHKPGLYPGYFIIPAAPIGEFTFLVVGPSVYYQETKNDIMTQVQTPCNVVAESIVHDFCSSHIGRIPQVAEPGVFWVPGAHETRHDIEHYFPDQLKLAEQRQLKWYEELVKIADDTFSRTNRHTSVSALQRLAAKHLALQRPWSLRTADNAGLCRFCKSELPYGAVKCPTCREIVDMAAYRELVGEDVHT